MKNTGFLEVPSNCQKSLDWDHSDILPLFGEKSDLNLLSRIFSLESKVKSLEWTRYLLDTSDFFPAWHENFYFLVIFYLTENSSSGTNSWIFLLKSMKSIFLALDRSFHATSFSLYNIIPWNISPVPKALSWYESWARYYCWMVILQ